MTNNSEIEQYNLVSYNLWTFIILMIVLSSSIFSLCFLHTYLDKLHHILKLILSVLSLTVNAILSSALPRNINVKDDASDAYVDALLANLRDYIASTPGLDPADLPEEEVSISQEVGFITFHGSARVYDGFFRGLSTIHVCILC